MTSRRKTLWMWFAVGALSMCMFQAGRSFHDSQTRPPAKATANLQASAMLKLTPESEAVILQPAKGTDGAERELVGSVVRLLRNYYVDNVTKEKETEMARGAVRGMLESLDDPDTRFLDPAERKLIVDAGNGRFHGIGAIFALRRGKTGTLEETKLVVVTPMPGSPAEKAGILPGDSVAFVDDKWVISHDPFKEPQFESMLKAVRNRDVDALTYQKAYEAAFKKLKDGMSIMDALESVTSKATGDVTIKVERAGEDKPIEIKLKCRDTFVEPIITKPTDRGVAYLRVTQFSRTAPASFVAALKHAQSAQAKALILDLRNNPGGLLDSAVAIASRITGGGMIASVQTKNARKILKEPVSKKLAIPVVVLVNEGTASVAELVAGTLKDSKSAVLFGSKTFGDGMMQTPLVLKDGSAAVLTSGKMRTANGMDFNGKGISPDREVKSGGIENDVQRDEAVKYLLTKLGKA